MNDRSAKRLAPCVYAILFALAVAAAPADAATDDPHAEIPFIDFQRARSQLVAGVVRDVDEEAVSCWKERVAKSEEGVGLGIGVGEFRYEILVVDVDGVPLRILAPQPTAYRPGDAFEELVLTARPSAFILSRGDYREDVDRFRVSLDELVRRHARFADSIQGGYLLVDGIMEREVATGP